MLPKAWHPYIKSGSESDMVSKCSKMSPGFQKVTIVSSKMSPQSSKIDPRTTPRPGISSRNDPRTQTLHVTLDTFLVTRVYLTLCTCVISKRCQNLENIQTQQPDAVFAPSISYFPHPTSKLRTSHTALCTSHLIHLTQHGPAVCAKRLK